MVYLKSLLVLTILLVSCHKSPSKNNVPAGVAPTNLVINATVSTDSSGSVAFAATANNATSYVFEFGNGDSKIVPSGIINYQYTTVGTNTYTVTATAKGTGGLSTKQSIQVNVIVKAPGTTLVWADEFNTDGAPDPAKWGYDLGDGCPNNCGWGNNELEYYTSRPENVIVKNGVLKINAIKESYMGAAYTSARILSKDKFEFTYGKVEIKAKIPAAVGTWPALWTLGSDISTVSWPACGEMDIMEARGSEPNKIFGTFHYPGRSGGNADGGTTIISNASAAFHIYSLEWISTSIKISVDGIVYHTLANSSSVPFNHDFFLIMNVAMGGNFAGSIAPSFTSDTMEVDYIRVYK